MTRLEAIQADITTVEVDVIVNAANSSLMGGGGVDGAIHRAGGRDIKEECRAIVALHGPLPTGEAVATGAGDLPARHVVHTVGPVWGAVPAEEAVDLLASCYRNSLSLARDLACRSVAFPNISTGVYRFPKQLAADTAVAAVSQWLVDSPDALDLVLFVCFGPDNLRLYRELLGR
ncbi:MAG TPA: O-acetyl-ADP-ribose deacetylase [Acidimicrobiia bacterium]|nr:O-acetyl-ADP-ribose deacetylase [Acidimicrobiia bacterium]